MDTIQKVFLIIHTLIALGIIALVLLQRGKGADAGAAFGAGASGTVFGARGSGSFFSRATAVLATAFFASSLTLAYLSSQRSVAPESILEGAPVVEDAVEQAPVIDEEMPISDMPSLEPVDDSELLLVPDSDMPILEDEFPVEQENQ
ncbi:MAG: preprotein translocase subunit SecG [Gammaproteobacteria bacterium]|nr:preprotein translocase subunit SecG [Gammaproteobacteria bacterium]